MDSMSLPSTPPGCPKSPVVVGLGANLRDVLKTLREAALALASEVGGRLRVESLYRTAPIGPDQPDFLNSAVVLEWPGDLHRLLDLTSSLELRFGRERNQRWGPRTLDLDLLWAGAREVDSPRLRIPHGSLESRAFALRPLLELVPDARRPNDGLPYDSMVSAVRSQRIELVSGPSWAAASTAR